MLTLKVNSSLAPYLRFYFVRRPSCPIPGMFSPLVLTGLHLPTEKRDKGSEVHISFDSPQNVNLRISSHPIFLTMYKNIQGVSEICTNI